MTYETCQSELLDDEKNPGSTEDFMASTSMEARFLELTAEYEARYNSRMVSTVKLAIGSRATNEAITRIHTEYDPTTKE